MAWSSERSLTSGWDAVFWVGVGSSSDDVLSLLFHTGWVTCGWNNVWDVVAGNVVGDKVSGRRERGGWDGEQLADVSIVDETEKEGLAAGYGLALGQAEGCGSWRQWLDLD